MARSRLPLRVSAGGASSSMRACSSLSAGVRPSPALVSLGRFTPFTGLCTTALRSQRYSNKDETAESLRRIVDPSSPPLQILTPGNQVRSGHHPEHFRVGDAGKTHKVLEVVVVRAACLRVGDVREPLDLGWHVGQ